MTVPVDTNTPSHLVGSPEVQFMLGITYTHAHTHTHKYEIIFQTKKYNCFTHVIVEASPGQLVSTLVPAKLGMKRLAELGEGRHLLQGDGLISVF